MNNDQSTYCAKSALKMVNLDAQTFEFPCLLIIIIIIN